MTALHWLPPPPPDWRARVRALQSWDQATGLAQFRLGFAATNALDEAAGRLGKPAALHGKPVRLALLGSATTGHLHAGIRVAGLRRGIHVTVHEGEFGQYMQELSDPGGSNLHEFGPTAVLLALDSHHLAALAADGADAALARIGQVWTLARALGCPLIHQTPLALHPMLAGSNEHRMPDSPAARVARINGALREMADRAGVHLLAVDERGARDGLDAWHNPALWHHAKQEIAPAAAPMYGELVARLLAALQGQSRKCLVLDLDNTLWGGVIGDDGLDGIVLGQGSAEGEAFAAFQGYAQALARRGVILGVCSKNDERNALEAFENHPEMVLRRADVAAFVANWDDKPANIRAIAAALNIGLDSLVFLDDNPFERDLVRRELGEVAVPEVGDDPVGFIRAIEDGGYFEALAITEEDRERTGQYRGNVERDALRETATDLDGYLRGLEMTLVWRRFDRAGLPRITQLINKSNQFNLTTRRYSDAEVLAVMADPDAFGLQLRLLDRFGDNGVIAIAIGRRPAPTC